MTATFVLKKTNGMFHFVLKTGDGEAILSGEQYPNKNAVLMGISSVQASCGRDDRYGKAESANGRPYFTLKAANHQVVGTSQFYATAAARDAGIETVKRNGASRGLEDNT